MGSSRSCLEDHYPKDGLGIGIKVYITQQDDFILVQEVPEVILYEMQKTLGYFHTEKIPQRAFVRILPI